MLTFDPKMGHFEGFGTPFLRGFIQELMKSTSEGDKDFDHVEKGS